MWYLRQNLLFEVGELKCSLLGYYWKCKTYQRIPLGRSLVVLAALLPALLLVLLLAFALPVARF